MYTVTIYVCTNSPQMTNNHLYWTVTTILQEQSGTRRAEIIKHMIKIASVLSQLDSVIIHPIVICHVSVLFIIFVYRDVLLPSLGYLKDLRNYNTMFAILRYSNNLQCGVQQMFILYDFCTFSGLNHSLVQRLKPTWEKVPGKYRKVKKVHYCTKLLEQCVNQCLWIVLGLGNIHGSDKKFCKISKLVKRIRATTDTIFSSSQKGFNVHLPGK